MSLFSIALPEEREEAREGHEGSDILDGQRVLRIFPSLENEDVGVTPKPTTRTQMAYKLKSFRGLSDKFKKLAKSAQTNRQPTSSIGSSSLSPLIDDSPKLPHPSMTLPPSNADAWEVFQAIQDFRKTSGL